MYNINYMLAKALQKDHLRTARKNRLARLIDAQKAKLASYQRKEKR